MDKSVFGHMRTVRTYVQSDQGFHCLLTESLDITGSINGEQMLETLRMHWMYLNLHILRKFEDSFLLGEDHIKGTINHNTFLHKYCSIINLTVNNIQ